MIFWRVSLLFLQTTRRPRDYASSVPKRLKKKKKKTNSYMIANNNESAMTSFHPSVCSVTRGHFFFLFLFFFCVFVCLACPSAFDVIFFSFFYPSCIFQGSLISAEVQKRQRIYANRMMSQISCRKGNELAIPLFSPVQYGPCHQHHISNAQKPSKL